MRIFFLVIAILCFTYVVRSSLKAILTFLFDDILGVLLDKLFGGVEPLYLRLKAEQIETGAKLSLHKLLGASVLFCLTVLLAIANYNLLFYALELILPSGEQTAKVFGFGPAQLLAVVIMLLELGIGFLLFELLGKTDLMNIHATWSKRSRWLTAFVLVAFLFGLVGMEVALSLKRTYETTNAPMDAGVMDELKKLAPSAGNAVPGETTVGTAAHSTDVWEERMRQLPYTATAAISFIIPLFTALSAISLQEMLLLLLWLFLGVLMFPLYIVNLIYRIIHKVITNIDDVLEKIISIITRIVELIVSMIVLFLAKFKKATDAPGKVLLLLLLPMLLLYSGVTQAADAHKSKIIVVLMDNTGSFKGFLHRSLSNCSEVVNALEAGDELVIMPIDKESLSNAHSPLSIKIPQSKTTLVTRQYRDGVKMIKTAGIQRIMEIEKSPRAHSTDLTGALVRAASLLKGEQFANSGRFLLIYSDMDDNIGRKVLNGTTLSGTVVRFMYTELSEKSQKNVEQWKEFLLKLGASRVDVQTPDQCEVATNMSWMN